jgi:hypothetical protein
MNYKVTFYKDKLEFLTERKSNYTNKLKKITSDAITKLANKLADRYEVSGTSGEKISKALQKMDKDSVYIPIPHPYGN